MSTLNTVFAAALAAFSFLAAAPGHAASLGDADPGYAVVQDSGLSRAEVRQQLLQAQAAGLLNHAEGSVLVEPVSFSKTRAQVRAETLEAIRLGLVGQGEDSLLPTPMQLDSIRMAGLRALAMNLASR